jgi:hypothetical protein
LPKSTRDDAHGISTGIAIIGRVKRLLKIPDRMQPEPRHPRGQRISFRMGINPGKFVEDHREIVAGWSVAPLGGRRRSVRC